MDTRRVYGRQVPTTSLYGSGLPFRLAGLGAVSRKRVAALVRPGGAACCQDAGVRLARFRPHQQGERRVKRMARGFGWAPGRVPVGYGWRWHRPMLHRA